MKVGTTEKIKFKRTKRALGLPLWQAVGLIESVWMSAYQNAPAGDIGKMSNEDIAAAIEWEGSPDELIAQLVKDGWLDEDEEFRLIVHDWSEHASNYLKGAFAKHGRLFADQVAKQRAKHPAKQIARDDATSTLPPILSNSRQSDSSQEPPIAPQGARETNGYCQSFIEWWEHYPKKVGKDAAYRAWRKAGSKIKAQMVCSSQEAAAHLLSRVVAYEAARQGEDPQFTPHPATWLNQGRWADDPATWKASKQEAEAKEESNMPPRFDEFKQIAKQEMR